VLCKCTWITFSPVRLIDRAAFVRCERSTPSGRNVNLRSCWFGSARLSHTRAVLVYWKGNGVYCLLDMPHCMSVPDTFTAESDASLSS
jgi:hypothetical protein